MTHQTTSADFFEEKYRQNADPWSFEHSPYEQHRYDAILRTMNGRRYNRGFEPGCSIGILTESLACSCDRLEAIDISPTAVLRAQERCKKLAGVAIRCGSLPESMPSGKFDLIVFSEIGYYFEKWQLKEVVDSLMDRLDSGGDFIAVHWLGTSSDHLLSGDEVHGTVRINKECTVDREERYDGFRLDRMVKR